MKRRHQWGMSDEVAKQVCKRCGAIRYGKSGGWGRAMRSGKSAKYCEEV